jgi:site-specific DNA-methyltransferase (adenine-specific)
MTKELEEKSRVRWMKRRAPVRSKTVDSKLFNQIFCADALSLMSCWPDNVVDACITDPPYNIAKKRAGLRWSFSSHVTMESSWDRFNQADYEKFTKAWLSQVCRVTKKNGNIFIFGSYHNIYVIGAIAQKFDLRIVNSIIWAKPNAQPNITCRMLTESTEQIIWLCNNSEKRASHWTFNYELAKAQNNGKQMRNFWTIPVTPMSERTHGKHPSQKPMLLMERIVQLATSPGDLVLDCFAGSGSTLVACKQNDRGFVGIEQSEEYCAIARARLNMQ